MRQRTRVEYVVWFLQFVALLNQCFIIARCSVTTFILSTAFVRTCVGCKRKAFLAPSSSSTVSMNGDDEERLKYLPAVAKGWLVEELLEATERCLFCENALVCIV